MQCQKHVNRIFGNFSRLWQVKYALNWWLEIQCGILLDCISLLRYVTALMRVLTWQNKMLRAKRLTNASGFVYPQKTVGIKLLTINRNTDIPCNCTMILLWRRNNVWGCLHRVWSVSRPGMNRHCVEPVHMCCVRVLWALFSNPITGCLEVYTYFLLIIKKSRIEYYKSPRPAAR